MSRLTKRVNGEVWWYVDDNHYPSADMDEFDTWIAMNKLANYEDLEDEGRLIRLPCSIGSAVWALTYQKDSLNGYHYPTITSRPFCFSDIEYLGITVFLTKKEAEQKLLYKGD